MILSYLERDSKWKTHINLILIYISGSGEVGLQYAADPNVLQKEILKQPNVFKRKTSKIISAIGFNQSFCHTCLKMSVYLKDVR